MYLIEESAVKAYCQMTRREIPDRLWKWLEDEGPIIQIEAVRKLPGGIVRFRAPDGLIDLPAEMVQDLGVAESD